MLEASGNHYTSGRCVIRLWYHPLYIRDLVLLLLQLYVCFPSVVAPDIFSTMKVWLAYVVSISAPISYPPLHTKN